MTNSTLVPDENSSFFPDHSSIAWGPCSCKACAKRSRLHQSPPRGHQSADIEALIHTEAIRLTLECAASLHARFGSLTARCMAHILTVADLPDNVRKLSDSCTIARSNDCLSKAANDG